MTLMPAPRPFDEATLRDALAAANLPTLLMVMFQLSGDRTWLREPYRPQRTRGMSDNDTGGFSPEIQAEIREAALRILMAWGDGAPAAIQMPDEPTIVEMISACMGEEVPAEFGPMMAEDMRASAGGGRRRTAVAGAENFSVVIIGAGISGISAAVEFKAAGIGVTIFEKNSDVGGTWWENRYPGCGVDTPSYVYSFSYFPRRWSTFYGKRAEVHEYVREVADAMGVTDLVRFETEVLSAVYDETAQRWTVTVRSADGTVEEHVANAVVSAVGQLNRPKLPRFPGADTFAGTQFHSADWPEGFDVTGLRVAVVGSGASAMQIVPAVADRVAHLTVLQRSPQWVAPSYHYSSPVPEGVHWLMEHVPFYHTWYRLRLSWLTNDRVHASLRIDPEWPHPERSVNVVNDAHRRSLTKYIVAELEGREDLLEKSLPSYPPFGKRMLLDNGWYAALRKPHVDLVTDQVASIDATGITTTAGERVEVDVIVYATGFEAKKMLYPLDIRGRSGGSIRELWGDEDARAYLGITVPGFPNFFVMYGPNINLGHGGSYMFFGELQARYITDVCTAMIERGLGAVEVRREAHDEYNRRVDEAHSQMIWSHQGMDTWYRNAAGRVVTNSPWRVVDYWRMAREVDLDDFVLEPATTLTMWPTGSDTTD
ncbi:4-hydroxyacetophenone monooxygenase [Thermomonospora echinospora]|uniref:4-hydroxyacetophenone monooxygenase n=1 Tax=Thermomonospora echinospora TaxID=1992 RepID=A0A1H6DZR3_9ACTN|nr:NAD(P)/FAD-dependent oxidoreductase [Thermomonospora echinospora]SEG90434.1 4-hydroxyacetophenone monooxygenase [Thermomonospora echinospora]